FVIDWNFRDASTVSLEQPPRPFIARLLHGHDCPGANEQIRDQGKRLLGSIRDNDILRVANHRSSKARVLRNRFSQWRVPLRFCVSARIFGKHSSAAPEQALPKRKRKSSDVREADRKIERKVSGRQGEQTGQAIPSFGNFHRRGGAISRCCAQGKTIRDESSRAASGIQEAFTNEQIIDVGDGLAGNRKLHSKLSTCR